MRECDRRSPHWRTARSSGAVALCVFLGGSSVASPARAEEEERGVCDSVAAAALKACNAGALDDYWIAVARCRNAGETADDPEDQSCQASAHQDLLDQHESCREQRAARGGICAALGGGPYDPQIDPAHFGPMLSNPY